MDHASVHLRLAQNVVFQLIADYFCRHQIVVYSINAARCLSVSLNTISFTWKYSSTEVNSQI